VNEFGFLTMRRIYRAAIDFNGDPVSNRAYKTQLAPDLSDGTRLKLPLKESIGRKFIEQHLTGAL